mgnify:CR=1 FL=1
MSARFIQEPAKFTDVYEEADVVVVGGGTAGVAAALAAAKNGAQTVCIEQYGVLGGTIIWGAPVINRLQNDYKLHPEAGRKQLVRGIAFEIVKRMVHEGGCPGDMEIINGEEMTPDPALMLPEPLKRVLFSMMQEYGVTLLMRTCFAAPIMEESGIIGVAVENKAGRGIVLGRKFIDCTGDGDLAARAGCDFIGEIEQDEIKQTTLCWGMSNVNVPRLFDFWRQHTIAAEFETERGDAQRLLKDIMGFSINLLQIPEIAPHLSETGVRMLHMISRGTSEVWHINCTRVQPKKGILHYRTALENELKLREQINFLVTLMKQYIPGFENAFVSQTQFEVGVRRTRTIRCLYDITLDDIVEERGFPDEIGRYGYMDLPNPKYHCKNGGSYGIPFRAILPTSVDNLLVAGRMITSNIKAHMSTRNGGCCMIQGEAAGTAAALCTRLGISLRDLDVKLLQDTLLSNGVYLQK